MNVTQFRPLLACFTGAALLACGFGGTAGGPGGPTPNTDYGDIIAFPDNGGVVGLVTHVKVKGTTFRPVIPVRPYLYYKVHDTWISRHGQTASEDHLWDETFFADSGNPNRRFPQASAVVNMFVYSGGRWRHTDQNGFVFNEAGD